MSLVRSHRMAASVCALIAVADLVQPFLLPWAPKLVGAVLGGAFYAIAAVLLARGVRWVAWPVILLPVVPITTLALWAAGATLPVTPDLPMVGVLGLQLAAAATCAAWMRQRGDRTT